MEPFSKHTIEHVNELFGRKSLVETLWAYAKRRENVALIGTRRFGKTCLFKSLCKDFLSAKDSPVFPVFLDFKEVAYVIDGTAEVYRFILARLIVELCKADIYTKKDDFPKLDIIPVDNWEDNYESLLPLKIVRLNSTMCEMIRYFSGIMEKTVLFMIDEYEHLFQEAFSNPEGFMPLRSLSSENEKDQTKPFAFWIAGAVGWKELCSQIGSGELNVINTSINVMPLAENDFYEMWEYEVSLCQDKNQKEMLLSKKEYAFKNTGGIPYYAKILGTRLIVEGTEPDFTILTDYFDQIYNTLNEEERKLAKEIAVLPKNCKDSKNLRVLMEKGLVHKNNNKHEIKIGYFADYLKTINNDMAVVRTAKAEELTEDIFSLFSTINEQRKRRKGEIIFDKVDVDFGLVRNLKKICPSEEDFKIFIGAAYLTFFEKTKSDSKAGNKLPSITHYSTFGNALDCFRHVYVGHLEEKMEFDVGQMTKSTALKFFIGVDSVPYHPDEYADLQIAVLTKYKEELVKLLELVRKER
jgi:hypothetical protein